MKNVLQAVLLLVLAAAFSETARGDNPIPQPGTTDRIWSYGEPEQASAYAEATLTISGIPDDQLRRFVASVRLANFGGFESRRHRAVLVAVACRWERRGVANPIAAAYRGWYDRPDVKTTSVNDQQLDQLYEQVLREQGLIGNSAEDAVVWNLLRDK
jgi:hypothetical protein